MASKMKVSYYQSDILYIYTKPMIGQYFRHNSRECKQEYTHANALFNIIMNKLDIFS